MRNNITVEDKIKTLLKFAVMSPSGHNSQPWKFKIAKNSLTIMPDYGRHRSVVDSENRELFISMGAVSKTLGVAAENAGMQYTRKIEGDEIKYVFKKVESKGRRKALFEAIPKRRTYREDFLEKDVEMYKKDKLRLIGGKKSWVEIYDKPEEITLMSKMVEEADFAWYKSRDLIKELEEWIKDDVELAKDGLSTGMINMYKIAAETKYLFSKDSKVAKEQASIDRMRAKGTPLFVLIVSSKNAPEAWIEAGETYGHLILTVTSLGLTNGIIGSLTELKGMRNKLAKKLGITDHIQMVLSVGYPKVDVPVTPRRPIEEMLVG